MTSKQVLRYCTAFQKRLGLGGWKIELRFVEKFENESQYGASHTRTNFQEAFIRIRQGMALKDLKETIVHELLHVRFGGLSFEDGSASDLLFETGIELTARALVRGR